jgi:hypothetical protein
MRALLMSENLPVKDVIKMLTETTFFVGPVVVLLGFSTQ